MNDYTYRVLHLIRTEHILSHLLGYMMADDITRTTHTTHNTHTQPYCCSMVDKFTSLNQPSFSSFLSFYFSIILLHLSQSIFLSLFLPLFLSVLSLCPLLLHTL